MRGASRKNLALLRFFRAALPGEFAISKCASGDCVSAAPADYSGGTVADFHGLLLTLRTAKRFEESLLRMFISLPAGFPASRLNFPN